MKKSKFNSRAMKKFTTEPKVVHEDKPIDLITQYNRMRSIATDIYNSDFFMISSKAEQKKIEASIACISATMVSMIGMEAIENSHDCLPDDSGDGDDRSWSDSLPDDSGDDIDTDKERHDAIKKMVNIAYGETKIDGVKKVAARRALNSVYGAPSSIMAMNRKILSKLGAKSPADKLNEDHSAFGNEYDEVTDDDSDGDEVIDYFEVNLGNFIEGSSYGQQYLDICRRYGFDATETLKQFEKVASQYYIQMINLVDVVDSQNEITADEYTLEPGSVFFVTNKNDESRSPVFMLIYAQPYTKVRSSDISKFSFEIVLEHCTEESTNLEELEESTKTNYIDFVGSDAYYNIGKVHLSPNTVIDLDTTLKKIKDEARTHGIDTITFVDTIGNSLDIFTEGKYTLEPGSLFCHRGNGWLNFMLIVEDKVDPDRIHVLFIEPTLDLEEKANPDDIEFIGIDAYYNIDTTFTDPNYVIDLDATLRKIKRKAKEKGIKTITFVDTIEVHEDLYADGKYSLETGSLFFVKEGYLRFILISENPTTCHYIDLAITKKDDSKEDGIEAVEAEDEILDSDEASIDHGINDRYANVDTNEISCDNYAKVSFSLFMESTENSENISFVDICNIYDFDVFATIKRIKSVAYLNDLESIKFAGTVYSHEKISEKEGLCDNGSVLFVSDAEDPYFIIIKYCGRTTWLNRINPVEK